MTQPDRRVSPRPVLLTFFVAGTVFAAVLSVSNDRLGGINLGLDELRWFPVLGSFLFLIPGVVVLLRSDWHPVGWLLVNLGFGFLFSFGPDNPSIVGLSTFERWWLWLTGLSVSALFWTVWSALILVFPDRISRRHGWHRRVALTVLAVDAACIVLTAFRKTLAPFVDGGVRSPVPLAIVPIGVAETAALIPNILLLVAIADFVVRHRRSVEPARSQYRWVVWAFLLEVTTLVVAMAVSVVTGNPRNPMWYLVVVGYVLVPISFMVAILRYRLYDIDRIVSRTLAYGLVAAVVGTAYAVPVLSLPRVLDGSSDVVIAVSTLAAAAAFNPARRNIQRIVDRRFNRARYDAEREAAELSYQLSSVVTPCGVSDSLTGVVARTVEPRTMSVWIKDP